MKTYASDQVFASFSGVDLTPGFADGSFMVIRRTSPTWTQRQNGLGGTIRLFNADKSGEVDFLIDTESKVHQGLLLLAQLDRLTRSVQGSLFVRDLNTKEAFAFTNAYIVTEPDEQRASATSVEVSWTFAFTTIDHIPNLGDNNQAGA